jgi:hypothetical protein
VKWTRKQGVRGQEVSDPSSFCPVSDYYIQLHKLRKINYTVRRWERQQIHRPRLLQYSLQSTGRETAGLLSLLRSRTRRRVTLLVLALRDHSFEVAGLRLIVDSLLIVVLVYLLGHMALKRIETMTKA